MRSLWSYDPFSGFAARVLDVFQSNTHHSVVCESMQRLYTQLAFSGNFFVVKVQALDHHLVNALDRQTTL